MKGKRTFWTSIAAGAVVGGLLSLLNKDARHYSKTALKQTGETISHYTKNLDETVDKAKETIENLNEFVSNNSTSALNALEQVESTVNKFLK